MIQLWKVSGWFCVVLLLIIGFNFARYLFDIIRKHLDNPEYLKSFAPEIAVLVTIVYVVTWILITLT
jgi:hypothetical protein